MSLAGNRVVLTEEYSPGVYADALCSIWVRCITGRLLVEAQIDNYEDSVELFDGDAWEIWPGIFGLQKVTFTPLGGDAIVTYDVGRNAGRFIPPVALESDIVKIGTLTDRSGVVHANPDTGSELVAVNQIRRRLVVINIDDQDVFLRWDQAPPAAAGAAATPGVMTLGPGDQLEENATMVPSNALYGRSAKAGHKLTIYEG